MGRNGNLIRLDGKRFGDLLVLRREGQTGNRPLWRCRCNCGNEVLVPGPKLRNGLRKSCNIGHRYRAPIVAVSRAEKRCYDAMMERCYNVKNPAYANYGGRGIRVSRAWRKSFAQFLSDLGPRPSPKHSLDRHPDWNGDYEKGNVRWATAKEQGRNKRTTVRVEIDGALIPLCDYTDKTKISNQMVRRRLKRGWSVQDAITTPSRVGGAGRDPWPQEWLDIYKGSK